MKKLTLVLLTIVLVASTITGCANSAPASPSSAAPSQASDAVTAASPKESSNPDDIVKGLSDSGSWIFSILSDVTLDQELNVSGTFYDKDNTASKLYRKLALYAQDSNRNVTANYTLTVPKMVVTSPSFRIQQGTVKGDIHVNADGFELVGTTVEGNLTFETKAQMESANITEGKVTGTISAG